MKAVGTDAKKIVPAKLFAWLQALSPRQMSGTFLREYLVQSIAGEDVEGDPDAVMRLALVSDVWIKARSYGILNKVFFLFALAGAILIAAFPVLAAIAVAEIEVFDASVVQTAITALTGLFAYIYRTYKRRQTEAEDLMRYICFSDDAVDVIAERAMIVLARVDQGLNLLPSKSDKPEGKPDP